MDLAQRARKSVVLAGWLWATTVAPHPQRLARPSHDDYTRDGFDPQDHVRRVDGAGPAGPSTTKPDDSFEASVGRVHTGVGQRASMSLEPVTKGWGDRGAARRLNDHPADGVRGEVPGRSSPRNEPAPGRGGRGHRRRRCRCPADAVVPEPYRRRCGGPSVSQSMAVPLHDDDRRSIPASRASPVNSGLKPAEQEEDHDHDHDHADDPNATTSIVHLRLQISSRPPEPCGAEGRDRVARCRATGAAPPW